MGEGEPKYLNSPETRLFDKKPQPLQLKLCQNHQEKFMPICGVIWM